MVLRCLPLILIAGSLFVAFGCRSTPARPPAQVEYVPPTRSSEVATIQGSRRRPGFLDEDHLGYVLMVDRKYLANPAKNWNRPVLLGPGLRIITAEYLNPPYNARADLTLDVKPGVSYQLKIVNGTEGADGKRFNDFWIVETAKGTIVTLVHHAEVTGSKGSYNPFSIN